MTIKSIARSLRPEVRRALRVSETQRAFHDRVLDGVRTFLSKYRGQSISKYRGQSIATK